MFYCPRINQRRMCGHWQVIIQNVDKNYLLDFRTITAYGCNSKEAIHQGADPARRCLKFNTTCALATSSKLITKSCLFIWGFFFCSSFYNLCTTTIDWKYPVQHTFRYKVPEYLWARIPIRWLIVPIVLYVHLACIYTWILLKYQNQ